MAITDEQLISIEAGHQIDLIRFGSSVGSQVDPRLRSISKYVREVLYEYDTITTIKQRDEIIKKITANMEKELGAFTGEAEKDFKSLVSEEVGFQYDVAKGAVGKGTAVSRPTIKSTIALINQKPLVLNGKAFSVSDYIGDYTPNQINSVKQIITAGWANGETTRQIAQQITGTKQVKGVLQASQRSAYMMAKDITTHISSESKAKVFEDNQDIVVGEKMIVTLDSRTSDICQYIGSQDDGGKEYYYAADGKNFPRPPFHPNCRTVSMPILAPEYRDITDDGLERPAVVDGTAESVDATTNWFDLAKANPALAEQSLGPSKAKLLDNMSAKEFMDTAYNRMGRPLTLEAMKESNAKVVSILGE